LHQPSHVHVRVLSGSRPASSQALDATYEAHLQAATPAAVDHYLQRVRVADSLAAVFED